MKQAMRIAGAVVALQGLLADAAAAEPAPAGNQAEARDERPLLWNGLRAGMSPREVLATLQRQGIHARLAVDPGNGREYVETPRATSWAGRSYLIAIGFVENRLFYVDINSHRMLSGRIPFERSHFSHVARLLTEQFGQPVQMSPQPLVSDVAELGVNTRAQGRFERDGVRADLSGNDGYTRIQRDVSESVTVRFWRIADAERFAASRPPPKPPAQP